MNLQELAAVKDKVNLLIQKEKQKIHKGYVKYHKVLFRVLDIMVVLAILFNFTALITTNIMVSEVDYAEAKAMNVTVTYQEMNPAAAKIHNLETPITEAEKSRARQIVFSFVKQAMLWVVIVWLYISLRIKVDTDVGLMCLIFMVVYLFMLLGMDCFHDIGLLVGKLLYGA